jgi:hypothetical protein
MSPSLVGNLRGSNPQVGGMKWKRLAGEDHYTLLKFCIEF